MFFTAVIGSSDNGDMDDVTAGNLHVVFDLPRPAAQQESEEQLCRAYQWRRECDCVLPHFFTLGACRNENVKLEGWGRTLLHSCQMKHLAPLVSSSDSLDSCQTFNPFAMILGISLC